MACSGAENGALGGKARRERRRGERAPRQGADLEHAGGAPASGRVPLQPRVVWNGDRQSGSLISADVSSASVSSAVAAQRFDGHPDRLPNRLGRGGEAAEARHDGSFLIERVSLSVGGDAVRPRDRRHETNACMRRAPSRRHLGIPMLERPDDRPPRRNEDGRRRQRRRGHQLQLDDALQPLPEGGALARRGSVRQQRHVLAQQRGARA